MWSIEAGKTSRIFQIDNDPSIMSGLEKFRSLSFSRDGRFVIAGGHGGRVCIWDRETGELIESIIDRVHAYLGYVMSAAINDNNEICLWEPCMGHLLSSSFQQN